MKKLLIIDGNSIINRAFYAIRALTNKSGIYTNGIYGFLNIYFKNMEEHKPDYVAVTFDLKAPTFRHKKFAEYKAQRKGMPEELKMQMPILKEVLKAMNVAIYEKEGYEADDIIGTVSRICQEEGVECLILTGDKDDLQLASDTTKVLLTVTRAGVTDTTVMDADAVISTYGVTPYEFIDVKGLMGDTSDNIPGVKGIGEKSAFSYIQKFKSIENLYDNLDDAIIKPAARQKLEEGREMAYLSKELCTIDRFVPMEFDMESNRVMPYNVPLLTQLFKNLEFKGFLSKLGEEKSEATTFKADKRFNWLSNADELKDLVENVEKTLVYKSFCDGADNLMAMAFYTDKEPDTVHFIKCDLMVQDEDIANGVKKVFENPHVQKVSDNIKNDIVLLSRLGVDFSQGYFDTSLGAYILDPSMSDYELSHLGERFMDVTVPSSKEVFGTGKSKKYIDSLSSKTLEEYVVSNLCLMGEIKEYETRKIAELEQNELFYNIELPLVNVLAQMEIEGVKVNGESLSDFSKMLESRIEVLAGDIYDMAGEEFNISSPKQLGVILFEKMGLKAIKKTKTGYSTDADVLEKLKSQHPIVSSVLEYRSLTKLKSTYADGLREVISPRDGKIHSKFNQTVTVTGRISSTEPNLQNIPVRDSLGREIRKMFEARDENHVLVDADYSQIELRVLAHASGDETMIEAFKSGEDIHVSTASNIFSVPAGEVTDTMRSRAKTVNFGIIYGMGGYTLAQDLKISNKEAKEYIDNYFERYSKVRAFMDNTVKKAKEEGYVTTLFGRRRYIEELQSTNHMIKAFGERAAMNTPIQGSAADIIKIAMVSTYKELKKNNLKSKLILQVHDELIIDAHKDELDKVKNILTTCMEGAAELAVPLVAEAKEGKTWYEAK